MSRVGMGIAGLGYLGCFHAANLARYVPHAALRRVVDTDGGVAARVGADLGVEASTDFDALLDDPTIAAIVVATPTSTHAELIEKAAHAGKHVFTEKPVSLDVDSTIRAIEAARSGGVCLQVGFHRRFDADWRAVATRARNGDLGRLFFFRSTQRDMLPPPDTSYIESSGDFFVDAMIHDFDCARWIMGEITEVSATATAVTSPRFAEAGDVDHAIVALRFESGAIGVIDGSRAAGYGYECSTEILGERATARIAYNRVHNVEWLTAGTSTRDYVTDFRDRHRDAYRAELDAFACSIRDDVPPDVSGADALAAFRVASAASRSHADGVPIDPRADQPYTSAGAEVRGRA